jgi:hypothetical protein
MPHVTVYFEDCIKLFDVMRAAEHIGCTLKPDKETGSLMVVRKTCEPTDEWSPRLPDWLKRQAD